MILLCLKLKCKNSAIDISYVLYHRYINCNSAIFGQKSAIIDIDLQSSQICLFKGISVSFFQHKTAIMSAGIFLDFLLEISYN